MVRCERSYDFTNGPFLHALNDLSQLLRCVRGGGAVKVLSSNILYLIAANDSRSVTRIVIRVCD